MVQIIVKIMLTVMRQIACVSIGNNAYAMCHSGALLGINSEEENIAKKTALGTECCF
ncbi:MAG: hypothetical protein IZT55_04635 [Anaerolineae bacterium]|nr:hypothetical protein [Anaerolineae bacterium]